MYKTIILMLLNVSVSCAIPEGLTLIEVTTANQPVAFVSANDGTKVMYIVERPGIIKSFHEGQQRLFLDISKKVEDTFSDQGLLGVVFDPQFSTNGFFYVNYTAAGGLFGFGATVLERYYYDRDRQLVDLSSAKILLSIDQFYHNHNGGTMHFGADGYLYVAMGDGGMRRDPENFAQNLSELLGKMLRIDVNPDIVFKNSMQYLNKCGLVAAYYLVDDNPYVGDANKCGEIFFSGLRSPWKWSFDKDNGDIFIGDVGQDGEEEINFVASSTVGGENFGWSCQEGHSVILPDRCPDEFEKYTDPIISYAHNPDNSGNSVVGGYRYRGNEMTELLGHYVYADTISGEMWFAEYHNEKWITAKWHQSHFLVVAFAQDNEGALYTVQLTGSIKKFVIQQ